MPGHGGGNRLNDKRVTFMMDDMLVKYVRKVQRHMQDDTDTNVSFSKALNFIVQEHKNNED